MSIYSFKDSVYICAYEVKRKSKLHLLCVVCAIERAHWEAQLKKKKSGEDGKDSTAESGKAKHRHKDI